MRRNLVSSSLLVLCTLALATIGGCAAGAQPQRKVEVSNEAYQLDELFTDPRGYTISRFHDRGDYRYYVVGPNGAQMFPTTKTVTETVTETVYVEEEHHASGK